MQKKWIKYLLILILQIAIWKILFKITIFTELWFRYIVCNYNQLIYSITSKFNFSISELFYVLIIFCFIFCIVKYKSITKLLQLIIVLCFIYNSLWGIVYAKNNFSDSALNVEIDQNQLKKLYCLHQEQANYYRFLINSSDTKVTQFNTTKEDYLVDFNKQQYLLDKEDWIFNYQLIKQPNVKWANFSLVMNYAGVLGYYNPFTIESNINILATDLKVPFTIAHELAHQMGFASENQANFIAYFIGVHSSLNQVKYAVYYKTMFSLLHSIYLYDPLFVKAELEHLPKGIKTDYQAELNYYEQFNGKTSDAFSALNDGFLKLNNQDGKISYSKYIKLVYYYEQIKKANH